MSSLQTVCVNKPEGLYSRVAVLVSQCANTFKSDIYIGVDNRKAKAKSLLEILRLGVHSGETVSIIAEGVDSWEAVSSLSNIISN